MKFQPALLEEITESHIAHDIKFCDNIREAHKIRKANIKVTQMLWIKKQAVIDSSYILFNPSALIMIFLN
jgi:hypothetical protein